jgi:hypothetical protein
MSAMHYAIRDNNLAAIKTLATEAKKAYKEPRVEAPKCYLKTQGTGHYNYRLQLDTETSLFKKIEKVTFLNIPSK